MKLSKLFALLILVLAGFSQQVNATTYKVIYLQDISHNATVTTCTGVDSLKFAPANVDSVNMWLINFYNDTIFADTLVLGSDFKGLVSYQNTGIIGGSLDFYIQPFIIDGGSDKTLICGGGVQMDTIGTAYDVSLLTFQWSPATGLDDTTSSNPIASPLINTLYYLRVTSPEGCVSVDSIYVKVNSMLVDAGSDKTLICGDSVQFDEVSSNYTGSGTLSYSWSPGSGLNDSTIFNPLVTTADSAMYTVTVLSQNGCKAMDSVSVMAKAMDSPGICIVGVNSENKNSIVWKKPGSSAIDSFYIYKETFVTDTYEKIGVVAYNDQSVFTDTNSNPNIQSNKYMVSIKDACDFESDKSPHHKTMHLSINQGVGNVWNLIWSPYEGFDVATYYIYRGTSKTSLELIGTSPASNTQYSDFSAPEGYVYYQIEVVSPNDCNAKKKSSNTVDGSEILRSLSNFATNSPVGMQEQLLEPTLFSLYPNPANDKIVVTQKSAVFEKGTIEIIDINGKVVKQATLDSFETVISVDTLTKGVYTIHIRTAKSVSAQKMIKT